jgi:type I restriction enzyme M protein
MLSCAYDDMRWSRFKSFEARKMFKVVDEHVFPFLRSFGGEGSAFSQHMKDARLGIPTPALLAKAVEKLDAVRMDDRDTKGDVYEYMLSKIASAGQNGQFRTPRHIIALMVELTKPTPNDIICDPASGTCGFLVAAGEYLRRHHPEVLRDPKLRKHFHEKMFNGFDFDGTMLRIGAMNMILHGVENANIVYRDSLAEEHNADAGRYSLILANPPFAGSLDFEATAKDLQRIVKTKKTELLFLALFLRLLKVGGRAAVIVPEGVLFGASKAHKALRHMLIDDHKLDAVVKLPSGVFRPYAGVSTAILLFTKTGVGGTDHVWFYEIKADGWSLDEKRQPLLPDDKLGPVPNTHLSDDDQLKSNLPDVLMRWNDRNGGERDRPRSAQSFCVSKAELIANDYDLSINRYSDTEQEDLQHEAPEKLIDDLIHLDAEIQTGLTNLKRLLREVA